MNPDYGNDSRLDPKAIARLPMVSDIGLEQGMTVVPLPLRNFADIETGLSMGSDGHVGYSMARLHVVDGRMPNPTRADEVLVNRRFADHYHLDVGSVFDSVIVTSEDFAAFENAHISRTAGMAKINQGEFGTRIRLRVSGIGEAPESLVLDEGFEQRATFFSPRSYGSTHEPMPASSAWPCGCGTVPLISPPSGARCRHSRTRARSNSRPCR